MANDSDEVVRRLRQWAAEPGWDPGPELETEVERSIDPAPDPVPVPPGRDVRADGDERSPRRVLGRDSLIILAGVLIAVIAAQFMPRTDRVVTGSATPIPSGDVITGSLPPPVSLSPGATFGPIVDPSLGLDASPTPIPVITMGPSPSPSPEPSPSVKPSGSPKPSVKPSLLPTHTPGPTPSPTIGPPPSEPPPPPTVSVSCSPPVGLTVDCTASVTNIQPDSETWAVSPGGTLVGGGNTTLAAQYQFAGSGDYTITVTVTGLDGSTNSDSALVTVTEPSPS